MKETKLRKRNAHKGMCSNSTENKNRHKSMKNKAVSKEMREKAEKWLTELNKCPNGMLRLVKGLKMMPMMSSEKDV